LPVNDILDKARRALNQEGYNLVYSNCEHFVTECRYGQPTSRQVRCSIIPNRLIIVILLGTNCCWSFSCNSSNDNSRNSSYSTSSIWLFEKRGGRKKMKKHFQLTDKIIFCGASIVSCIHIIIFIFNFKTIAK
jgi:hypothetical protein